MIIKKYFQDIIGISSIAIEVVLKQQIKTLGVEPKAFDEKMDSKFAKNYLKNQ